ncbi:hypothetical protein F5878DRAFT_720711 [Lentinula raphanica]|uniref:Uncharacterized protein n=1 Tax=Lentinula raphanica TaxID=153919 RepID=A0AA38UKP6_9AGAR|nr:hypothetical protein F5880DRAFT_1595768 [Lentinula raphanica]KAJ3844366.1 hypothetical protein F5878DRAFT_720711 [Lentinula raphanica]
MSPLSSINTGTEEGKRRRSMDKTQVSHLSRQLQLRLQYARLKVENGWHKQNLNEVENLYFRRTNTRPRHHSNYSNYNYGPITQTSYMNSSNQYQTLAPQSSLSFKAHTFPNLKPSGGSEREQVGPSAAASTSASSFSVFPATPTNTAISSQQSQSSASSSSRTEPRPDPSSFPNVNVITSPHMPPPAVPGSSSSLQSTAPNTLTIQMYQPPLPPAPFPLAPPFSPLTSTSTTTTTTTASPQLQAQSRVPSTSPYIPAAASPLSLSLSVSASERASHKQPRPQPLSSLSSIPSITSIPSPRSNSTLTPTPTSNRTPKLNFPSTSTLPVPAYPASVSSPSPAPASSSFPSPFPSSSSSSSLSSSLSTMPSFNTFNNYNNYNNFMSFTSPSQPVPLTDAKGQKPPSLTYDSFWSSHNASIIAKRPLSVSFRSSGPAGGSAGTGIGNEMSGITAYPGPGPGPGSVGTEPAAASGLNRS